MPLALLAPGDGARCGRERRPADVQQQSLPVLAVVLPVVALGIMSGVDVVDDDVDGAATAAATAAGDSLRICSVCSHSSISRPVLE